jgi:thioredoxin-like negative regulator of GroEL
MVSIPRSVTVLVALSFLALPGLAGGEPFLDNPKLAFARAADEDLPLLIGFHTTWCEACERMDRTTWKDAEVQALLRRVVPLSVDGDRNRNLTARYKVVAYPTIVIAEPSGLPILVVRGMQDIPAMQAHLAATLDNWDTLRVWAHDATLNPPDPEALIGLAEFAFSRGVWDQSERLFRRALRNEKHLSESIIVRSRVGLAELMVLTDRCREARKVLSQLPEIEAVGLATRRNEAALSCDES